jgi:hypothetical protein
MKAILVTLALLLAALPQSCQTTGAKITNDIGIGLQAAGAAYTGLSMGCSAIYQYATAYAGNPGTPSNVATAINKGVAKYQSYCTQATSDAQAVATALQAIQAANVAIQAAIAASQQ